MKTTTATSAALKKMNILQIVETVVELTDDQGILLDGPAKPYLKEMAKRLDITPEQALLTAVFVDQCDDSRINNKDLARHFDVRPVKILAMGNTLDSMVKRGIIVRRKDSDGDITYRMPAKVVENLRNDKLPEPEKLDDLTAQEWFDVVDGLLKLRGNDEMTDDELYEQLHEVIEQNQQLHVAQRLHSYKFSDEDLVLLLVLSNIFINDHDEHIIRRDISDFFCRSDLRRHTAALEAGNHVLMNARLVEHACHDGQVNPQAWCITQYCKQDLLKELNLNLGKDESRANLTHHEDISPKQLYYNERVTRQVDQLRDLLGKERMKRVQEKLREKGMRTGFTCIFYGAPGTGKTETVLQLARETGRDIMLVDVPNVRSKWVGETEKNIKGIFDRYRAMAEQNEKAPILLFNEADAVLNKRAEGATGSVDKMENAMQNIILQEMEKLDGIMIATTNLTGSLDAAFERRFLYKIEFDKPSPKESRHIWQAMLTELSDEAALELAGKYSFSGGQIENIARKQLINNVLEERDSLDLTSIREACEAELISKKGSRSAIGF